MSAMNEQDRVRKAICSAIEELNEMSPRDRRITPDGDARLAGAGGSLDSLGLVNLIVLVEQKVEEQFATSISLMDGDLVEGDSGPFESVSSLTAYVTTLLGQKADV